MAVSYTHLDVDKRQLDIAREEESKEFKKSFGKIDKLKTENLAIDLQSIQVDSSKAVSYTHLDVYKRQRKLSL